jgi:hypothetical protein
MRVGTLSSKKQIWQKDSTQMMQVYKDIAKVGVNKAPLIEQFKECFPNLNDIHLAIAVDSDGYLIICSAKHIFFLFHPVHHPEPTLFKYHKDQKRMSHQRWKFWEHLKVDFEITEESCKFGRDIISHLVCFFTFEQIVNFALTCKAYYNIIINTTSIWRYRSLMCFRIEKGIETIGDFYKHMVGYDTKQQLFSIALNLLRIHLIHIQSSLYYYEVERDEKKQKRDTITGYLITNPDVGVTTNRLVCLEKKKVEKIFRKVVVWVSANGSLNIISKHSNTGKFHGDVKQWLKTEMPLYYDFIYFKKIN